MKIVLKDLLEKEITIVIKSFYCNYLNEGRFDLITISR